MDKKKDINLNKDEPVSQWIHEKLESLTPERTPAVQSARARLSTRILQKENSMLHKVFGPKYRTAWITMVIVAVLGASLSIPQVRVIANSFLGLFRVEQIEAVNVGISLDNLPGEMESRFRAIDHVLNEQLSMDRNVRPVEVADIAEASAQVGFHARIPILPDRETRIFYQDGFTARLTIDQSSWQTMFDSMGYQDFVIPKSADGAEVRINIPAAVIVAIGDCQYNEINEVKLGHPDPENCTVLLQSTSPTIEAPAGFDINRAGQILLQALGMSESEAKAFSATVNWATTLVIPVPSDMSYQRLMVDGVNGIFMQEQTYPGEKAVYTLVWLKDNLLHALIGAGSASDARQAVDSLK